MGVEIWLFLGIAAMVTFTPGPDTALSLRNSLAGGRSAGIATAFGVSSGQMVWALATALGLVAIIAAAKPVFLAIQYLGAAYLIWLGMQSLWFAWRGHGETATDGAAGQQLVRHLTWRRAYLQGLLSNLGNPKMAVFFASLLPNFVPGPDPDFLAMMGLGALFGAMGLSWLIVHALLIDRAGTFLQRPRIRRVLDSVTGIALVAFGIRIATMEK